MKRPSPPLALLRAAGHLLLRAVRVAFLLFLVVIPIPVTFNWMKRLVGDRKNLPAETLRKD